MTATTIENFVDDVPVSMWGNLKNKYNTLKEKVGNKVLDYVSKVPGGGKTVATTAALVLLKYFTPSADAADNPLKYEVTPTTQTQTAQASSCWSPFSLAYMLFTPTCNGNSVQWNVDNQSTENPNDNERVMGVSFTAPEYTGLTNGPFRWQNTSNGDTYTSQTFNQSLAISAGDFGIFDLNTSTATPFTFTVNAWDVGGNNYTKTVPGVVPEPVSSLLFVLGGATLGYMNRQKISEHLKGQL